ncbi:ATP-binding protein [Streptomyces sp. H39-S7]|uniref:ATP-binding protein n=1 Tax=Streptomyces sp. H39-S7 TaxID=3004357 RepID=UPI0022AFEC1C|nr:ATP-binding protein [Streptomyces sp. H39-S7]MCZ4125056.1 ATP-binding protein [Streptomyces sp. H39-S7]
MRVHLTEADVPACGPAVEEMVGLALVYRAGNYGGEPGSLGAARQLADEFLDCLAADFATTVSERFRFDVMLVVTELLTNAERYACGPSLLELAGSTRSVVVTVWDSSTALPVVFPPDPSRVGGHGLEIVNRLCEQVTAERVPVGKRVRAVLRVHDTT